MRDFQPFVDAGITSFDTAGEHMSERTTVHAHHIHHVKKSSRSFILLSPCGMQVMQPSTLCSADIYGPSEGLIGRYLHSTPDPGALQVLTKFCCFGRDLDIADSKKFVARVCTLLMPAPLPSLLSLAPNGACITYKSP